MKLIKVAVVIPTHTNIKSSLHVLLTIYSYLAKKKKAHVAIFTDNSNSLVYKEFETIKIKSLDYSTFLSKIFLLLGLPRYYYIDLISKLKGYDIIESSNPEFYIFAYQSYIAAKKYNAKLILRTSQTVEGFFLFKLSKYIIVPVVKKAYDYASWLFFTNPEAAKRAERLGLMERNSTKKIIIGHATDISVFKPLKIKKYGRPIILSVGGLYRIKGHHIIIRALAKIRERCDADLWIVGDGYYSKNLKALAENLGINEHVKFLGSKTKEELAKIYNMSHIFVLANYQEITPAVNEALACGVPVVVMECGGRSFVIPNESYGLVSRRFDIDDMSNKVIRLIEDKKLCEKVSRKGREHILKNFSIEVVAEKFYKCFTK